MNPTNITVYTQPDCPPCSFVKEFLTNQEIPFIEKDIRKDPASRKELIEKYKAMSTPLIVMNHEVFYSSDISKLVEILNKKK
ncbi:NrdH-redoxin [Rossellomorea vietnamensis]|uniref:NrdH-redoxin n=1 Tax=Rossellomorea vietnamensis TaxID=218284 RepID=A0A5D4M077_9BACI|nr:glutaredoxin domain-containing protein [Rossellomorea vietnamensis]TYR95176.1 NrdH-redoxin [Rossellomorea vietnamensis]